MVFRLRGKDKKTYDFLGITDEEESTYQKELEEEGLLNRVNV
jgi:hypothetical protein